MNSPVWKGSALNLCVVWMQTVIKENTVVLKVVFLVVLLILVVQQMSTVISLNTSVRLDAGEEITVEHVENVSTIFARSQSAVRIRIVK